MFLILGNSSFVMPWIDPLLSGLNRCSFIRSLIHSRYFRFPRSGIRRALPLVPLSPKRAIAFAIPRQSCLQRPQFRCHPGQAQREPGPTRRSACQSVRCVSEGCRRSRSLQTSRPRVSLRSPGVTPMFVARLRYLIAMSLRGRGAQLDRPELSARPSVRPAPIRSVCAWRRVPACIFPPRSCDRA